MTIENDTFKYHGLNSSSFSKLVYPSSYKSISSFLSSNLTKSSIPSSLNSPSLTSSLSSSVSSSSSTYSLSSGVSSHISSNNNNKTTDLNLLEESLNSVRRIQYTPLSEFILNNNSSKNNKDKYELHDSVISTIGSLNNKLSLASFNSDQSRELVSTSSTPTTISSSSLSTTSSISNTPPSSAGVITSSSANIIENFTQLSIEQQTNLIDKWVPFEDIQKRIFVPDADPKKFIFNYNSSNLSAKKELNYLGIVDVNPDEYTQKYGAQLTDSSNLPKYILDIKTPDNLRLAADVIAANGGDALIPELEGDVEALKYVDLEREDLGIYRHYLKQLGITS